MAFLKGDLSAPKADTTGLNYSELAEVVKLAATTYSTNIRRSKAETMAALDSLISNSASYTTDEQYKSAIEVLTPVVEDEDNNMTKLVLNNMLDNLERGRGELESFNGIQSGYQTTVKALQNIIKGEYSTEASKEILSIFEQTGMDYFENANAKTQKFYKEELENIQNLANLANDIMEYDYDPNTPGFQAPKEGLLDNAWDALERLDIKYAQKKFDSYTESMADDMWQTHYNNYERHITDTNSVIKKAKTVEKVASVVTGIPTKGQLPKTLDGVSNEKIRIENILHELLAKGVNIKNEAMSVEYSDAGLDGLINHIRNAVVANGTPWKRVGKADIIKVIKGGTITGGIDWEGWGADEKLTDPVFAELIMLYTVLDDAEGYLTGSTFP